MSEVLALGKRALYSCGPSKVTVLAGTATKVGSHPGLVVLLLPHLPSAIALLAVPEATQQQHLGTLGYCERGAWRRICGLPVSRSYGFQSLWFNAFLQSISSHEWQMRKSNYCGQWDMSTSNVLAWWRHLFAKQLSIFQVSELPN